MRPTLTAAVAVAALATGCGGDDPRTAPAPPPPPDAGTRTGHGADARRVAVPERDDSPPEAEITLRDAGGAPLARTSQPATAEHPRRVGLGEPRLRGTAVGRDPDGGVARVRVSIKERIVCRRPGGGSAERLRTRYFPPSQIERIRSNPGARLPTEVARTLRLALAGDRCGRAEPVAVRGELWGEAINGSGLEAVTPHLRFTWRRIARAP